MEFFEALKTFITTARSEPGGFKEVTGTNLSDDYFAYKDGVRSETWWWVVDKASGLAISQKLKSLKECREFLANLTEEELEKIAKAKQEPFYKEWCEKLANWKPQETESFDFNETFDALNDLYEEVEQIELKWRR